MSVFDQPPAYQAVRQPDAGLAGDVTVHAVLAWRSDSIMLARLRPVFADLVQDAADRECEALSISPRIEECRTDLTIPRSEWCAPCVLRDLAQRVERTAT